MLEEVEVESLPSPRLVVHPDVVPTPAAPEPEPTPPKVVLPQRVRVDLEGQLRRCPDSPRGAVVLEVRERQLASVDFEAVVAGDPWHTCAARVVARAGVGAGQRIVNL